VINAETNYVAFVLKFDVSVVCHFPSDNCHRVSVCPLHVC